MMTEREFLKQWLLNTHKTSSDIINLADYVYLKICNCAISNDVKEYIQNWVLSDAINIKDKEIVDSIITDIIYANWQINRLSDLHLKLGKQNEP